MQKIKIISSYHEENVEQEVNDFISTHEVTDIQFQVSGGASKIYACMISYIVE